MEKDDDLPDLADKEVQEATKKIQIAFRAKKPKVVAESEPIVETEVLEKSTGIEMGMDFIIKLHTK